MLFFEAFIMGFACTLGVIIALGIDTAWKYVLRKTGGKK